MQRSGMKHLVYVVKDLDSSLRFAPLRMTFLYHLELYKHPLMSLVADRETYTYQNHNH